MKIGNRSKRERKGGMDGRGWKIEQTMNESCDWL